MTARARRSVRWVLLFVSGGLLALYAGAVALRVLYPLEEEARVRAFASDAGLDPALVASLIRAESRFHAHAVSARGAIGLMQVMPDTAAWIESQLGLPPSNLFEPEANLRLGTWYLRYLIDRFGSVDLALAAYNAGPSRVAGWLASGQPAFTETEAFVRRVVRGMPVYRVLLGAPILVRITPSLLF